ncbi:MAG: hypothetical protein MJ170_03885 [Alphaproteobacteria bacterium]|nr:hypothetical protein [Alphaproteobacteria bacterium]
MEQKNGGAIENNGTITSITGNFEHNSAATNGGAIYNTGRIGNTDGTGGINGNFNDNITKSGSAIYNTGTGTITNIIGNFTFNNSTDNYGAIYNFGGTIGNTDGTGGIEGDFEGNTGKNGSAIANTGVITNIIGNFTRNSASANGGAIINIKKINKVTGNFTKNSAQKGGAVYNNDTINFVTENDKSITFDGNYVTAEDGLGGAIYNNGTLGLYAKGANDIITFVGGADDTVNNKYNIDGIYNQSTLNINGFVKDSITTKYLGTVNLYKVSDREGMYLGETNVYGGTVNVKDTFTQMTLDLKGGTLNLGRNANVGNFYITDGAKLSLSIPDGTFENYENEINTLTTGFYSGVLSDLTVDYDATAAEGSNMDKIIINGAGSGSVAPNSSIKLTSVNVIKDGDTLNNGIFLTGTPEGTLDNLADVTETITSTTTSGGWKYTFTPYSKGVVSVTREVGKTLAGEIQDPNGSDTFSVNTNPYMTGEDLGSLAGTGRNFTIFGNGSTIDGNGYAGITVTDGQTLTLNNADMKNFTDGAITNYGTTNIISQNTGSLTFSNNAGYVGGAISSIASSTEGEFSRPLHIEAQGGNITFKENNAEVFGGGLIISGAADIIADKGSVVFDHNTAPLGGAIGIQSNTKLDRLNLVALNNDIVFKNNIAENDYGGGAMFVQNGQVDIIANGGTVKFEKNSTTGFGGAILGMDYVPESISNEINIFAENNDVMFSGNTAEIGGGAIANVGKLNIKAKAGHTVEFVGDEEDSSVDSIANASALGVNSVLTINDAENGYTGDVILQDVVFPEVLTLLDPSANPGDLVIGGGRVFAKGTIQQNDITVKDATLSLSEKTVTASKTTPLASSVFTLNNSTLNLQNNSTGTVYLGGMRLVGSNNIMLDADLAKAKMDQLNVTSVVGAGNIVISDINLLSDANDDYVELSLFADGTTTDVYNKVSGNLNGLKYSTIYKYNASYDSETGMIGFTRYNSGSSDDFNPYLYAPSAVANTTATMTTQIAALAMDKMDDVVHAQGRSGGDTPSLSNAWVRVMGLNDNVEFNNFENIDSRALTVAAGVNTDKITCGDCGIVFGAYAGYIGGKQKYTDNDIDQNGGYVGLSSALTLGDAFLTATVNGGLLKNKANNMYGTDRFNTLWLGTGLKAGYNYALTDSVVLQPNVYGGYTLVNTKDYTSVSGVKIATNNLNFFEIDPGLKLSAVIADGWIGSVQGKYAIVMDNGADITANDIALQNISTKNYIEYGIGIDKSLTDAFYLGAKVNRHDGGRTGWNGSIEFRYKF